MGFRKTAAEAVLRVALFGLTLVALRFGYVAWTGWRTDFSSSFELSMTGWVAWIAWLAAAGAFAAFACLPGRPRRYRWTPALVVTVPALSLLAHGILVYQTADTGGIDLPSFLGGFLFYMDAPGQHALAVIAGFGIVAGFQPGPVAPAPPSERSAGA